MAGESPEEIQAALAGSLQKIKNLQLDIEWADGIRTTVTGEDLRGCVEVHDSPSFSGALQPDTLEAATYMAGWDHHPERVLTFKLCSGARLRFEQR